MNRLATHPSQARRGNALVLVSALLVMLTLIAAAYLSRTRTQRITAAAIHDTTADSTRANQVAQQLAADVTQHLFLRPIDPNAEGAGYFGGNSNAARRPASPYDARYGVEPASTYVGGNGRGDMLGDAINPALPLTVASTTGNKGDGWPDGWNFAPYSVIPWTNWPDHVKPLDLDAGSADPSAGRFFPVQADPAPASVATWNLPSGSLANNPIGNPGFGDTRWLRSSEPVRMTQWRTSTVPAASPLPTVPDGAYFSHWAHLSFPATGNNGWRVVPDISDVEGHALRTGENTATMFRQPPTATAVGTYVGGALSGKMTSDRDGLGTPYEQWLPFRRPTPIPTGASAKPLDQDATFVSEFVKRRNLWFNRTEYLKTMGASTSVAEFGNPTRMLPNLFKLDDPLGVGRSMDPGAAPVPASDEYVENSPRNIVARTFADADGDGWTDSFWFLVPVGQEKNVRTVVGVSIVDNAGMVDVNVATRADRHTTTGFTPADLALVTSEPEGADTGRDERSVMNELGAAPWTDTRVGLFDNPRNFVRGRFVAGDPRLGGNPAGAEPGLYDLASFEQAFDPYRWAGRPTPQLPRLTRANWNQTTGLQPDQDSGEPTFLGSLGLWYDTGDFNKNFWNGYLYLAPRSSARDPLGYATAPKVDMAWMNARSTVYNGPWQASSPPGTPARWMQSEPMFATATNRTSGANSFADPTAWRWESWFDAGFNRLDSAPASLGPYPGSPFMRSEERARWFRHAVTGELRAFAPFSFGNDPTNVIDASNLLTPTATAQREFQGVAVRTRPFDTTDEIELRAFGGLNDPSNMSRLERALNGDSLNRDQNTISDTLLRSTVLRGEAGRAGMQLTNAQWVKDLRRSITTVSGQRNDLMPSYLWVGRPYLAISKFAFNNYEAYQSASLWLDLHPQVPGPVDENGDGVINATELSWGSYDLMRASTSADPFPDGVSISITPPVLSPSDWSRGVSLFENVNRKFDLRRPLVIQRRVNQYDIEQTGATKPFLSDYGLIDGDGRPRYAYAYSAQEQRRAMLDFAVDVRQRLRPALRTASPQRQRTNTSNPYDATLFALGPRQAQTSLDGKQNVAYAGYTDRFLDQLRLTFTAKVAGAVPLANRGRTLRTDQRSLSNLADLAWRSAWSTEAMTASMSANLATWRSRPDLIRENIPFGFVWPAKSSWSNTDLVTHYGTDVPLRPVWQPILPWFESGAYSTRPDGNPYFSNANTPVVNAVGVGFDKINHRPDYGDSPNFADIGRKMWDWASAQTIRAVDPARPDGDPDVDVFGSPVIPNSSVPAKPAQTPNEDTADVVFPGNEKHPFLTECFFAWVYPATTTDGSDPDTGSNGIHLPTRPDRVVQMQGAGASGTAATGEDPSVTDADATAMELTDAQRKALSKVKLVAVVNGQVGRPRLVPDPSDPLFEGKTTADQQNRRLIPTAKAQNGSRGYFAKAAMKWETEDEADRKRDELNEIRTPVVVIQVANPWNEPIRLGDFRLNIFGNLYDFPDYELDADGKPVLDFNGQPVPLMLPPANEMQPATATVYLIANEVGNGDDNPVGNSGQNQTLNADGRVRYEQAHEADLADTAMFDPLFRRRWLDYFDLYEYTDGGHLSPSRKVVNAQRVAIDRSTSPVTSCLFSQPTWTGDSTDRGAELRNRLSRSKLLNAMDRSEDNLATTQTKHRITDLWKFKYSLTPDAMRRGVVLERILRDPSGRNGPLQPVGTTDAWPSLTRTDTQAIDGGFQRSALTPVENTINRYRLRFWPLQDLTSVFPRDSRDPSTIFPPQTTTVQANQAPTVEPTTLIVDRFDADDDFNHWSTVSNGQLNFEASRVDEAAITTVPANRDLFVGTPAARPDNKAQRFFENPFLNQDRSLVTGGRFWTACAQITLPPTRHRWPDGRDRRMVDVEGLDQTKYGAPDDPKKDAYWLQLQHLPSLPVTLGSTMMVSTAPSTVRVSDFLSRYGSKVYPGAIRKYDLGSPSVGPKLQGQQEVTEADFTSSFDSTASDPGTLNASELQTICQHFPLMDRDRNGVPDEMQKIFVGFDEPEGNVGSFPPPTALSLLNEATAIQASDKQGGLRFYRYVPWGTGDAMNNARPFLPPVLNWPYDATRPQYTGNQSLPFTKLAVPGIMLRTGTESRDYFTTWTRVSRSWARNFDAKLATRVPPALADLPRAGRPFDCDAAGTAWQRLQKPGALLARQEDGAAKAGKITARKANYPDPDGAVVDAGNPRLQWNEAVNRPMWEWERQIVNTSANGSSAGYAFEAGRTGLNEGAASYDTAFGDSSKDQDGNIRPFGSNLSAWYGAFAPDRVAPRFVFASRTEPDRCDRPVDMRTVSAAGDGGTALDAKDRRGDSRPIRQELIGYQCGRYGPELLSTSGVPRVLQADKKGPIYPEVVAHEGTLIYRAPKWQLATNQTTQIFTDATEPETGATRLSIVNDGEYLTALGDTFSMDLPGPASPANPANAGPRDPDGWLPDPIEGGGGNSASKTDLLWMNRRLRFNWLTSPVVAPLPDMIGLGWSRTMSSTPDASDALPYDAYPELIVRKPTAFNCQTVVDDRLSRDVSSLPVTGDAKAFYKNNAPAFRRFLYAKYADFLFTSDYFNVADGVTRFVYPPWARPVAPPGEYQMSPGMAGATNGDPLTTRGAYTVRLGPDGTSLLGMDLYPFNDPQGAVALSLYRVYMGDKGGRLVDHQGKRLVLDRATMRPALHNGDIAADVDPSFNCVTPNNQYAMYAMQKGINADMWLMQGVWNTIDRTPHEGSLQMLHKDDDFEQLGELADVFLWGPAYRVYRNPQTTLTDAVSNEWSSYKANSSDSSGKLARGGYLVPTDLQTHVNYLRSADPSQTAADRLVPPRLISQCRATFAEIMTGRVPGFPVGEGPMVNRLQVDPPNIAFEQSQGVDPYAAASNWGRPQQMGGTSALRTPYAPNVPWGMRVFDAFVLDGPGSALRYDWTDQFAGQTVEFTTAQDGTLQLPSTASDRSNVFAFEDGSSNAGNVAFNASAQDGKPVAPAIGFGTRPRFTAARPAGALVPQDMYRDSYGNRDSRGYLWKNPVFTRATFAQWEQDRTPSLAGNYRGFPVPGMVNVNTAPLEVMRTMPHMTQVVYDDAGRFRAAGSPNYALHTTAKSEPPFKDLLGGGLASSSGRSPLCTDGWFESFSTSNDRAQNPVSRLPESISLYRDQLNPNPLISVTNTSSDSYWFVRDPLNPMNPAVSGNWLRRTSAGQASALLPPATPAYPSYTDRGEWAANANGTSTTAQQAFSAIGSGDVSRSETPNPFSLVYYNRGMRATPGVETIGEILGMNRTTRTRLKSGQQVPEILPVKAGFSDFPDWEYDKSWAAQLAGMDPYRLTRTDIASGQGYQSYVADPFGQVANDPLDARLSTDRQGTRTFDFVRQDLFKADGTRGGDGLPDFSVANCYHAEPDRVAGDSEERNLLFKGISNIASTRSDVFTAYFRVRTIRQGADGRWNAMDPESILSDTRYVMCIDRSKVNRPTDKPRIVYFTQVND